VEGHYAAVAADGRRDTLMAHYQSNHVAVAYGDIFEELVALSEQLGLRVRVMGSAATV
jgi:L-fucose isomerase-like protein